MSITPLRQTVRTGDARAERAQERTVVRTVSSTVWLTVSLTVAMIMMGLVGSHFLSSLSTFVAATA